MTQTKEDKSARRKERREARKMKKQQGSPGLVSTGIKALQEIAKKPVVQKTLFEPPQASTRGAASTPKISTNAVRQGIVIGGPKPAQILPALASDDSRKHPFKDPGYILQEKYDGSRCLAIKKAGHLYLMGRSWKNDFAPRFPGITQELSHLPANEFVLDGELTFFKKGKSTFITALATEDTKTQYDVKLMLFDIISWKGRDLSKYPLMQRLAFLERTIPRSLKHLEVVKTHTKQADFEKLFKHITEEKGGEGVVMKKRDSPYAFDSRENWVKVKKQATEDVVVIGITNGTGVRVPTFGALILGQYDKNGQMKAIGKSSGFTNEMLEKLYKTVMAMPVVNGYPGVDIKDVKRWVAPKMVIEVEYMEKTAYGILRHPRFLRMRDDKLPSQCKIMA